LAFKNQNFKLKQTIAMTNKLFSKVQTYYSDTPVACLVPILADIAVSLAILADHVIIVDENDEATEL
jgi:hypothetical protein